jgi:drug/metabolite transporter (DMT)-like permease
MSAKAAATEQVPPAAVSAPDQPRVSPWIYVWLATVPLTWGFNFISLKVLFRDFTVLGLLSGRYLVMVWALFLTLWVFERDLTIQRRHLRYFIGFAIVCVGIYQICFAAGVMYTLTVESSLLISTAPIWTMLITAALGWEALTWRRGLGTLVGFAGIACVVLGGLKAQQAPLHHAVGLAVMTLAAILWASYAIFARPLLTVYSPLKVTAYIHLIGALILIPLGAREALSVDWFRLQPITWVCFFYFALLAGVYGFVTWYRGVAIIGSSRTMLFQYCVPVIATLAAFFLLAETPTLVQVAGIFITLVGLQLAVPGPAPGPGRRQGIAAASGK